MDRVWFKLKRLKVELKKFPKEEFAGIIKKISNYKQELEMIHSQLLDDPSDINLQIEEKSHTKKLGKWLSVEESTLKQKATIHWLANGDSNTRFFFALVKQRRSMNKIFVMYDEQGMKLTDHEDIADEIQKFYKNLPGIPILRIKWL